MLLERVHKVPNVVGCNHPQPSNFGYWYFSKEKPLDDWDRTVDFLPDLHWQLWNGKVCDKSLSTGLKIDIACCCTCRSKTAWMNYCFFKWCFGTDLQILLNVTWSRYFTSYIFCIASCLLCWLITLVGEETELLCNQYNQYKCPSVCVFLKRSFPFVAWNRLCCLIVTLLRKVLFIRLWQL